MSVRVYAAQRKEEDDLVEYEWEHMGQTLRAVGSRNAVRLEIDLNEVDTGPGLEDFGESLIERVRGLVKNTVRLRGKVFSMDRQPYEIEIPWPDTLVDGMHFSTNPNVSINSMDSVRWFWRVDFSVDDRALSIMFYFKPGQLMHPQDGSKWFPEEFRAKVHERARQLGKLPAIPPEDAEE